MGFPVPGHPGPGRLPHPILFLTAKVQEADIMEGLGIGGDDYITKPFGIGELRARVAAHLRREREDRRRMRSRWETCSSCFRQSKRCMKERRWN